MKYLLAQCPAFARNLQAFRAEQGESVGLTVDLGVFGEYAAEAIARNNVAELMSVAEAARRLVRWPDGYVQVAAKVGFLEGLTNLCLAEPARLPFERLARLLSPDVIALSRGLDYRWGTQTPGV